MALGEGQEVTTKVAVAGITVEDIGLCGIVGTPEVLVVGVLALGVQRDALHHLKDPEADHRDPTSLLSHRGHLHPVLHPSIANLLKEENLELPVRNLNKKLKRLKNQKVPQMRNQVMSTKMLLTHLSL